MSRNKYAYTCLKDSHYDTAVTYVGP